MLHEGASKLVTRLAPEPTRAWLSTAIEAYCRTLLGYGTVAVHDLAQLVPDVDLTGGIAIVRDLADAGRLPVRVHASIRTEALDTAIEARLRSGAPLGESERARFGWLKIFGDGSLFSRTAFLLEPWDGDDERGAPPTGLRGLPTAVNRQPAVAFYLWQEQAGAYLPLTIDVLRVTGGEITEILIFHSDQFPRLGLPERLPASGA